VVLLLFCNLLIVFNLVVIFLFILSIPIIFIVHVFLSPFLHCIFTYYVIVIDKVTQ